MSQSRSGVLRSLCLALQPLYYCRPCHKHAARAFTSMHLMLETCVQSLQQDDKCW
jgi:hypothetical protein